jgi:prepilin signal peptidase PulO-like enzyme (type II secretory pathway)
VAIVDWQTLYIYDVLTLPMAAAGICGSFLFPLAFDGQRWQSASAMAGMALTMWLLAWLGKLYAKRDALGGGDIKLMVAAAGFLGWPVAWKALLLAAFVGLPTMLLYQRRHGLGWRDAAPFGPALALTCAFAAWDLAGGGMLLRTFDLFF